MAHYKLTQTGARLQADVDLTENLQNDFSESSTYTLGAVVVYQSKLWECTTPVVSAGAWNAVNWTQIHLSDLGGAANPMTSVGDMIVGGPSGVPTRLAKGSAGQFFCMDDDGIEPEWKTVPLAHGSEF